MKKTITPKPSYIVSLLFLVPVVGYAFYIGFALPGALTRDGESIGIGTIAVLIGIFGFALFMTFLIIKGIMYVVNFSLSFDDKNVEITTFLGERTAFRWEDLQEVINSTTGELEFVLKTGKSVKFKSRMLQMGEFFRERSKHVQTA